MPVLNACDHHHWMNWSKNELADIEWNKKRASAKEEKQALFDFESDYPLNTCFVVTFFFASLSPNMKLKNNPPVHSCNNNDGLEHYQRI